MVKNSGLEECQEVVAVTKFCWILSEGFASHFGEGYNIRTSRGTGRDHMPQRLSKMRIAFYALTAEIQWIDKTLKLLD